jgi:enoyl-CoA hydratase/carnithine racemase
MADVRRASESAVAAVLPIAVGVLPLLGVLQLLLRVRRRRDRIEALE